MFLMEYLVASAVLYSSYCFGCKQKYNCAAIDRRLGVLSLAKQYIFLSYFTATNALRLCIFPLRHFMWSLVEFIVYTFVLGKKKATGSN